MAARQQPAQRCILRVRRAKRDDVRHRQDCPSVRFHDNAAYMSPALQSARAGLPGPGAALGCGALLLIRRRAASRAALPTAAAPLCVAPRRNEARSRAARRHRCGATTQMLCGDSARTMKRYGTLSKGNIQALSSGSAAILGRRALPRWTEAFPRARACAAFRLGRRAAGAVWTLPSAPARHGPRRSKALGELSSVRSGRGHQKRCCRPAGRGAADAALHESQEGAVSESPTERI